ncbi:MAG: hypothetical protein FJ302_14650 [Planctomycetes bacterium]|nr:hypothetical protein [Planctomycetota bacterium]
MTKISSVTEVRGPSWLLEVLDEPPAARCVRRWWQWAVLSLGCVSGCASLDQVTDNVTQPLRSTGHQLARAGDRVGDLFESKSPRPGIPANLPANQGMTSGLASQARPSQERPMTSATAQAGAISLPISEPTATQAIHNAPIPDEKPPESLSAPPAPPAVELLPAPTADVQSISHSQPVAAKGSSVSATTNSGVANWCRIRVRNIGQHSAPQVAVTVSSPENVKLVSKDGDGVSAPVNGKMEFTAVPEVGPNEEIILMIGVGTAEQRGNRLRVQVRDGLGGSNQDVQARWQATIETME